LGRGRPCFPPDFACPAVLTLMRHAAPALSPTGLSPAPVGRSSAVRLMQSLKRDGSTTPSPHRVQPSCSSGGSLDTLHEFGLLPVRSPLLRESSLFLGVREMFQFPRFPPHAQGLRSAVASRGCPIRTPLDRRLPAPPQRVSSRGHVLHRPLAPRHPPCALLRLCLPNIGVMLLRGARGDVCADLTGTRGTGGATD
jgi:hypothetical protein